MLDIKNFNAALDQLASEKGISKEKILETIDMALAAAYKRDYGKKTQLIRAKFDIATGKAEFWQVKLVVDESMIKSEEEIAVELAESQGIQASPPQSAGLGGETEKWTVKEAAREALGGESESKKGRQGGPATIRRFGRGNRKMDCKRGGSGSFGRRKRNRRGWRN